MLRVQRKLEEVVDKTLEAFTHSEGNDTLLLMFSGDAFVVLHCCGDWPIEEKELELFDFDDRTLIDVGITTAEALLALRTKQKAEREQAKLLQQREEYARLKKIFAARGEDDGIA